jgi:putative ABC transport system ATP-binding protein
VLNLLRRSVDELGQTVIMVTHDAGAASIADSLVFLKDGRIELMRERMSRDEIYDTIKRLETAPASREVRPASREVRPASRDAAPVAGADFCAIAGERSAR